MAHVARIDEHNIVREVHVINNHDLPDDGAFTPEVEQAANEFQGNLGLTPAGSRWLLTSYNGNFRGTYAGIGYTYDEQLDEFVAPEPVIEEESVVEDDPIS
jgi:hypothetical protein